MRAKNHTTMANVCSVSIFTLLPKSQNLPTAFGFSSQVSNVADPVAKHLNPVRDQQSGWYVRPLAKWLRFDTKHTRNSGRYCY